MNNDDGLSSLTVQPTSSNPMVEPQLQQHPPVRHAFHSAQNLFQNKDSTSTGAAHSFHAAWSLEIAPPTRPSLQRRGSADLFLEAAAQAEERDRSRNRSRNRTNDNNNNTMNNNSQYSRHEIQSLPDLPALLPLSEMEDPPFFSLSSSSSHCEEEDDDMDEDEQQQEEQEDDEQQHEHEQEEHVRDITSNINLATKATVKRTHTTKGKPLPHVYRDFSSMPDSAEFVRKKTGGVSQPFPEKLYEMLETESARPAPATIVTWLPHGRAFIVHKPKLFTLEIMPLFFRQSKLTSFQRQLNLYGFRRITQGPDAGAYYHELFLRGRPQLCMRMVRQKVKGTGHKQPTDVDSEPNFYAMPPILTKDPAMTPTTTTTTGAGDDDKMLFYLGSPEFPVIADSSFQLNAPQSPSLQAANLLTGLASASKRNSISSTTTATIFTTSGDMGMTLPLDMTGNSLYRNTAAAATAASTPLVLNRYVWNSVVQAEEL